MQSETWRIEEPLPGALAQGWVFLWINGHCFQVLREVADAVIADHIAASTLRTALTEAQRHGLEDWHDLLDAFLFGEGNDLCLICQHPFSQHAYRTGSCRTCWKNCPNEAYKALAALHSPTGAGTTEAKMKLVLRNGVQPVPGIVLNNVQGIECQTCKMVSFNPNDIESVYCGHCHEFGELVEEEE